MNRTRNIIGRSPIIAERVRKIDGGFSFVPHRFLHAGFFAGLSREELLLYFFPGTGLGPERGELLRS